ncbi:MAG TPA: MATE family efflux transporter, partial [Spirochaetota bacterium]|nr:MATE family efflux transporter [Spirochaetota bacterium]
MLITNLGAEQYAGYAILTSLISWFSLFEFGLSPSLQNFISESRASNRDFNSYLQATVPILLLILLIAIFFVSIISAPLQIFLFKKVSDDLLSEPLYLVGVVGFLYSITALCGIAYKVYYAEQKGHLANIYPAIGSILSYILLLIFGHFGVLKDNLKFALLIMIMPTTCIAAYAFYDVFLKNKKINVFKFDSHLAKIILSRAYRFAGFSFFSTIVLQVDYIVMSRVIDAHGITQYNLIAKVYFLIFFIYSTMLFALWPTCTELMEKRNITKVYKLVTTNMLFGWLVVIAGTVMFLFT